MVVIVQENQLRTISSRVCVPLELAAPIPALFAKSLAL
jgi:hypothetical protein